MNEPVCFRPTQYHRDQPNSGNKYKLWRLDQSLGLGIGLSRYLGLKKTKILKNQVVILDLGLSIYL